MGFTKKGRESKSERFLTRCSFYIARRRCKPDRCVAFDRFHRTYTPSCYDIAANGLSTLLPSNRACRMQRSAPPVRTLCCTCTSCGPASLRKMASVCLAQARASRVFPVPGGPCSRMPLGGRMPMLSNICFWVMGSTTASISSWISLSKPGGQVSPRVLVSTVGGNEKKEFGENQAIPGGFRRSQQLETAHEKKSDRIG